MEMKHREMNVTPFYELSKEIMVKGDEWSFKQFASNEQVWNTKTIIAWAGADRHKLVEYVTKYGYDAINLYVLELGKALREAEVKS